MRESEILTNLAHQDDTDRPQKARLGQSRVYSVHLGTQGVTQGRRGRQAFYNSFADASCFIF